jgi:hypothetical protein
VGDLSEHKVGSNRELWRGATGISGNAGPRGPNRGRVRAGTLGADGAG